MGKSKDLASGAAYQDQTESDTRYVNTAGDSMTGELLVRRARSNTAGDAALTIHPSDTTVSYGMRIDQNTNSLNFDQVNSGVTRMSIDSAGRVTKPSQPSFFAYMSQSNPTITVNPTKIPYSATSWNVGSHFDTSNSRFVAPIAGKYCFQVNHNVYGLSDDQYFRTRAYVNGSSHQILGYMRARGGGDHTSNDSFLLNMSANDYVEIYTSSNDGSYGMSAAADWNSFSGFLIG